MKKYLTPPEQRRAIAQLQATIQAIQDMPTVTPCYECDFYQAKVAFCDHWRMSVPVDHREKGCEQWMEAIPF
ncbi:hypothetical protein [Magnetococcus sp. PR-3]|uniref:hypothetical protein n=1 Tax=Magnetococcus sp. PR-3 TaxID=3120355 RepID=UPI002FCE6045